MSTTIPSARAILVRFACADPVCPCQRAAVLGSGDTHCPLHNDPGRSLDVREEDGKVIVACRHGCAHDVLVNELVDRGLWPLPARGCTVEQLAEAKKLPVTLLQRYGIETEAMHNTPPRV